VKIEGKLWFVHKYEASQAYGGPEEGGWWYDLKTPIEEHEPVAFTDEEEAFAYCREMNEQEYQRRKKENQYGYTSVLSYRDEFFTFDVSDSQTPEQPYHPHYE
jgi:hypothetical protein